LANCDLIIEAVFEQSFKQNYYWNWKSNSSRCNLCIQYLNDKSIA
jgi:hypothetical protein